MGAMASPFRMPVFVAALLCMTVVPAALSNPNVVLIGDAYRGVLLRGLAGQEHSEIRRVDGVYELVVKSVGMTVRSLAPGGSVTSMANLLHASDIALIVVDSTAGPAPAIREHILIARQARVPMLAMLLANVEALYAGAPEEAVELLAMETQEIRALLSTYDLDGNSVLVYQDAKIPQAVEGIAAFGIRDTLRALSRFAPRRAHAKGMGSASEIWGAVYLLTELEADGHAVSLAPKDSLVVWSEGTQSKAMLASRTQYHPGDFREMPLSMEAPLKGMEGSRILLVSGDRVVGLGDITQFGR